MKSKIFFAVALSGLVATIAFGSFTQIIYTSQDIGANRWQYTYTVNNTGLMDPIKEFTIYFDYGLYDNLVIETTEPLSVNWDEIVLQPEPVLADGGIYDALALNTGINQGQSVSGFSISFDWLGTDEPCSQFYEIINPDIFETIDSGFTVPEPAMLLLFGFMGLYLRKQI